MPRIDDLFTDLMDNPNMLDEEIPKQPVVDVPQEVVDKTKDALKIAGDLEVMRITGHLTKSWFKNMWERVFK